MTSDDNAIDNDVRVGWSSIWVTGLAVILQFILCYTFFFFKRKQDEHDKNYDLFETRQHTLGHRSPPPFESHWFLRAYNLSDVDTLRCVGLDSYMFLRLLRFGARITALGTLLSIILIPIYATGTARGNSTEGFNQLTLARVDNGDKRLAATVVSWYIFIGFILYELHLEWKSFALLRHTHLAKGDADVPKEFRYSILCEQVPMRLQSKGRLKRYFDRLFPGKVALTTTCMEVARLDKLVRDRQKVQFNLKSADLRATHTNKRPEVRVGGTLGCCGGQKVDAIEHYKNEWYRLTKDIDYERALVPAVAAHVRNQRKQLGISNSMDALSVSINNLMSRDSQPPTIGENQHPSHLSPLLPESTESLADPPSPTDYNEEFSYSDEDDANSLGDGINQVDIEESWIKPSSTAFVVFTSLRAKQAAAQCALTGNRTSMRVFHAPDSRSILWENINFPLSIQETSEFGMRVILILGILFWAIPVSFVNSLANLNSILQSLNMRTVDPSNPWYGFVSGLVPVIALALLMEALYALIVLAAKRVIRLKSLSDVDAYVTYWYQLYQFANLWLIVIGGSIFNQLYTLLNNPQSIGTTIANAMIGSSVFFLNMILTQSIGKCALDLSRLAQFSVKLLLGIFRSEKMLTTRQLNNSRVPESYRWGYEIPKVSFIFMIVILYCPIVPIMEVFGFLYFAARYVTYKHQFLHVNAQLFEGGGNSTWLSVFVFIIAIIYLAEFVFVAYMGLKQSPMSAGFGFVPLVITIIFHLNLKHNTMNYLQNLPLQTAASVDIKEGERCDFDPLVYLQPSLNETLDEQPRLKSGTQGSQRVI